MGSRVAQQLVEQGHRTAWASEGRSVETRRRAAEAGLEEVNTVAELADLCDVMFSICPPEHAELVAESVIASDFRGIFVEANSISSMRLDAIKSRMVTDQRTLVDGCLMGSPPTKVGATRLYLAGGQAEIETVSALFDGSILECIDMGSPIGAASSLKIAHTTFVKLDRVLAALAHGLARSHGVGAHLQAEAERSGRFALKEPDHLPSVAARAWRWLSEMDDAADMLRAAGYPSDFVVAARSIFEAWSPDKDDDSVSVDTLLQQLKDLP
jgi:3-hydroxyisobutyrate dehydrogenase-like beta-hydroxyacid dehydrogenase